MKASYVTGGLAFGRTDFNSSIIDVFGGGLCGPAGFCAVQSLSTWHAGWSAGGGVEWAFGPAWSFKVEYLHYDLGSRNEALLDPTAPMLVFVSATSFRGDVVRGGVNFLFH